MKGYVLDSSVLLNYMKLVMDVRSMLEDPISSNWNDLPYNFYAKRFRLCKDKEKLFLQWENLNGEVHFLSYNFSHVKNTFLNKIYWLFNRKVYTDDVTRAHNVFTQVLFPEFCKINDVQGDFSKASSSREALDYMLCNLYNSFFTSISIDQFITMFNLKSSLPPESLLFIKGVCQES